MGSSTQGKGTSGPSGLHGDMKGGGYSTNKPGPKSDLSTKGDNLAGYTSIAPNPVPAPGKTNVEKPKNIPRPYVPAPRKPVPPAVVPPPKPRKIPGVVTKPKAKPYSPPSQGGGNDRGGGTGRPGGTSSNNSAGVDAVQNGGVSGGKYSAKRDPATSGVKHGGVTSGKTMGKNGGSTGSNNNSGGGSGRGTSGGRGMGSSNGGLGGGGSEKK